MKTHKALQASLGLRVQRKRLRTYEKIGKQERGKSAAQRECVSKEAVRGNTVCADERRVNIPGKP